MKISYQHILVGLLFFLSMQLHGQQNLQTIGELPDAIMESSGLIFYNNHFITHNDSGNEPVLYELDTVNLSIARTVVVTNVENTDWEAITQDEEYIYIGDFGNNVGTRTDLAVHRIEKSAFLSSSEVEASTILFTYADQTDFTDDGNSDWDAEAFFVLHDQLIILTKQWQSLGSLAYMIPKEPGNHIAQRVGAVENVGLITDATYDVATNKLVVLGYSSILSPFVGVVEQVNTSSIFDGYSQTSLGLNFVQAEGITQVNSTNYFFTSERYSRQNPTIQSSSRLFSFQLKTNNIVPAEEPEEPEEPETPEEPEIVDQGEEVDIELKIFKDGTSNEYRYSLTTDKEIYGQVIFNALGQQVWQNSEKPKLEGSILLNLETSIYYLALFLEDRVVAKPFVVYK